MLSNENIRNFISANFNIWSTLFWLHQRRELKRYRQFFDTIESQPLTELQRRSVILDERRNLVVAGAGTGKTSVIIAKVGYLLKSGKCKPEEILLLAFNKDAAKELSERCEMRFRAEIKATTFHALGNQIVGGVEDPIPSLTKLATDQVRFDHFLQDVISELRKKPAEWKKLKSFILGKLKPYKAQEEFKTLNEYKAYVTSVELRALSSDLVKSFAELDIANFLFLKGVKFEYEARYPHEGKRYQPDFFLPDCDIFIEHFGIDRNGRTAPFIDATTYQKGMEWKRKVHRDNGTILLETYSWQKEEGNLLNALDSHLKNAGVKYQPVSEDAIFEALKNMGYTTALGKLIGSFLAHFKSNQITFGELKRRATASSERDRAHSFLEVFAFFFERYEAELSKPPREIDFNDMISKATKYVERGHFHVPWKYLIVDEFQDISAGRYLLIDAMLKSRDDFQFLAVGDDWQSINRFAGSDISIMNKFREFFGRATIVKLDHTFRFNDRIADVSGQFIQKNPHQIRKTLTTPTVSNSSQVYLHWTKRDWDDASPYGSCLMNAVHYLLEEGRPSPGSLIILARYNHLLPKRELFRSLVDVWPGDVMEPRTVHGFKGREADYVIFIGMSADKFGFPSEIEDDPLLALVLAEADPYPNAEERRLFYVAATRAKRQAHFLVDRAHPSIFALELLNEFYDVKHIGRSDEADEICPECKSGLIEEKRPDLFACSNCPYCEYVAPLCDDCTEEHMAPSKELDKTVYECVDDTCEGTAALCPKCRIGAVIPKTGRYGDFFGCHIWPRCDYAHNTR